MCLAVTAVVIWAEDGEGEVLIDGRERPVSFIALPDAVSGDHVIVSLGMAVERITAEEAREIDAAWDEISQLEINESTDEFRRIENE